MEEYFKTVNEYMDKGWKMSTIGCDEPKCRVSKNPNLLGNPPASKHGARQDILPKMQNNK